MTATMKKYGRRIITIVRLPFRFISTIAFSWFRFNRHAKKFMEDGMIIGDMRLKRIAWKYSSLNPFRSARLAVRRHPVRTLFAILVLLLALWFVRQIRVDATSPVKTPAPAKQSESMPENIKKFVDLLNHLHKNRPAPEQNSTKETGSPDDIYQ